jgi:hypothetical protein
MSLAKAMSSKEENLREQNRERILRLSDRDLIQMLEEASSEYTAYAQEVAQEELGTVAK